jgi:hypothetical protein
MSSEESPRRFATSGSRPFQRGMTHVVVYLRLAVSSELGTKVTKSANQYGSGGRSQGVGWEATVAEDSRVGWWQAALGFVSQDLVGEPSPTQRIKSSSGMNLT